MTKLELREFVEDSIPFIHKSNKTGKLKEIFTSKNAHYKTIEQLTDALHKAVNNKQFKLTNFTPTGTLEL